MERIRKKNDGGKSANPELTSQRKPAHDSAQGDFAARIDNSPLMAAQRKKLQSLFGGAVQLEKAPSSKPNQTGLPDQLKAGIENLSGLSMDHVRVHYNSTKPAQLNAHAYAQGSDIHVAPGQEQHLPHEAWHVVQQAQGRVRPTMQMKGGVPVNDDQGLEREADVMGARAVQSAARKGNSLEVLEVRTAGARPVMQKLEPNKLNVAGEDHEETDNRLEDEMAYCRSVVEGYWLENEFKYDGEYGDDPLLRAVQNFIVVAEVFEEFVALANEQGEMTSDAYEARIKLVWDKYRGRIRPSYLKYGCRNVEDKNAFDILVRVCDQYRAMYTEAINGFNENKSQGGVNPISGDVKAKMMEIVEYLHARTSQYPQTMLGMCCERSKHMWRMANKAAKAGRIGVWKVGAQHVRDMINNDGDCIFHLETQEQFNDGYTKYRNAQLEKEKVEETHKKTKRRKRSKSPLRDVTKRRKKNSD